MKQAILVIDVQQALFDVSPPPQEADAVIARINAMCARARQAKVPVFLIQHEDKKSLLFGTSGWQLQGNLVASQDDTVVRKQTPDAFLNTTLANLLEQQGIQQIVIAGYASEFCIDTTVRRAAALGYEVVLASDAHTTHDKAHASGAVIRQHHNATLCAISSFGHKIFAIPSNEVTFQFSRDQ